MSALRAPSTLNARHPKPAAARHRRPTDEDTPTHTLRKRALREHERERRERATRAASSEHETGRKERHPNGQSEERPTEQLARKPRGRVMGRKEADNQPINISSTGVGERSLRAGLWC